jgi:hypothetical protein
VDIRSARVVVVSVLIALSSVACGDSGVHFYAINESHQPLIAMFTLDGTYPYAAYELPANASGETLQSLGPTTWTGTILVLDPRCRPVWQLPISAGTGGVLISSDGTISWTPVGPRWPREEEPPGPMRSTTACDASLRS